jgi:threonine/homoserine/homoserine lactone efflux protein
MTIANREQVARPSSGRARRRPRLFASGFSMSFGPKITCFLLALLPQFEGSPALQSLFMSLFFIASGTAANLLRTLFRAVDPPGRKA